MILIKMERRSSETTNEGITGARSSVRKKDLQPKRCGMMPGSRAIMAMARRDRGVVEVVPTVGSSCVVDAAAEVGPVTAVREAVDEALGMATKDMIMRLTEVHVSTEMLYRKVLEVSILMLAMPQQISLMLSQYMWRLGTVDRSQL